MYVQFYACTKPSPTMLYAGWAGLPPIASPQYQKSSPPMSSTWSSNHTSISLWASTSEVAVRTDGQMQPFVF